MKRYQLAELRPVSAVSAVDPRLRWKLWAHGATMSRDEALERIDRAKAQGYPARLLPLPKEREQS